jgi:hypothetical protein
LSSDPHAQTAAANEKRWLGHVPLTAEERKAKQAEYNKNRRAREKLASDPDAKRASIEAMVETRRLKREAVETESEMDDDILDHREVILCASLMLGRHKLGKWAKELIRWHMDALVLRNRQILDGVVRLNERAEETDA